MGIIVFSSAEILRFLRIIHPLLSAIGRQQKTFVTAKATYVSLFSSVCANEEGTFLMEEKYDRTVRQLEVFVWCANDQVDTADLWTPVLRVHIRSPMSRKSLPCECLGTQRSNWWSAAGLK